MKPRVSQLGAVGLALAAFTFFVLADTALKFVGASALPAPEVVAAVGLSVVVLLLLLGLCRNSLRALWPRRPFPAGVRASLDLFNNLCVVVALRHLPLALFYILVFLTPMVAALLAALFLGERLHWRKSIAIVVGFLGVVIAVDPWNSARPGDWTGYLACMVCVACFSTNIVWSRVMMQTEAPESLTFFSGLVTVIVAGVFTLHHAEPISLKLAAILALTGLFSVCGGLCFFVAIKHTSAATVSQYHYSQLLTGTGIAYLVWRERPTHSMFVGAVLIIGSGLYSASRLRRPAQKAPSPEGALS